MPTVQEGSVKMAKSCKTWCGVERVLPYSRVWGRTWCTKKCRDKFERENRSRPTSVMQAFERVYGPMGDAEDAN